MLSDGFWRSDLVNGLDPHSWLPHESAVRRRRSEPIHASGSGRVARRAAAAIADTSRDLFHRVKAPTAQSTIRRRSSSCSTASAVTIGPLS